MRYTREAHENADEQKQDAILSTLYVAVAQDEDLFVRMDEYLQTKSTKYADSSQRLAMLQRTNQIPPDIPSGIRDNLKSALKSLQTRTSFTSISTNLTELLERDFSEPKNKTPQ